jgi:hypothetical protein
VPQPPGKVRGDARWAASFYVRIATDIFIATIADFHRQRQPHRPAGARELQGVRHQVADHLRDLVRVCAQSDRRLRRQGGARLQLQVDARLSGLHSRSHIAGIYTVISSRAQAEES